MNSRSDLQRRLQRSKSWLERASSEQDIDTKYILLWVAFNAAYALERNAAKEELGKAGEDGKLRDPADWQLRKRFFARLTSVRYRQLYGTIRARLWEPVARIMENEYVFRGFWDSLTDDQFDWAHWQHKGDFESRRDEVMRQLKRGRAEAENTGYILRQVFDRLGVLRNQLMHGCATRQGTLNRRQVVEGTQILEVLVPLFVDIMADNPEEGWGKISYPVRDDIREDRR